MEDFVCNYCGHELEVMGILGNAMHGRCRSCGLLHTRELVSENAVPGNQPVENGEANCERD